MEKSERLMKKAIGKINSLIAYLEKQIQAEQAGIVADEQGIATAQGEIKRLHQSTIDRADRIKKLEAEKAEAIRDKAELEN